MTEASRQTTTLIASQHGGMVPCEGPPDYSRHNAGVTPHFFTRSDPVVDEKGVPILDATGKPSEMMIELCTISIAGDSLSECTCPAVDSTPMSPHIRFGAAYDAWKRGEASRGGTPLNSWGQASMSPRMVRDLESLHVHSVEDLAAISDSHISRLIDGRAWRSKALEYLRLHPKLEEANEIQLLKDQIAAMAVELSKLKKDNHPQPARKRVNRHKPLIVASGTTPGKPGVPGPPSEVSDAG